jgi:hypothetical protein
MPRGFALRRLIIFSALCLIVTSFAGPGTAQPVGGPTTGGNDPTGGNTTGGNTTGGNTTGGNVNTGGNVGVNVGEERRYIVEFDNFVVLDETGCDLCGSDETQFIIRTSDYALVSELYGDLDSPYLPFVEDPSPIPYRFKRCAVPAVDGDSEFDYEWECDQKGKAAPLSFTIAAWEDDGDIPFTGFCHDNPGLNPDPVARDIWRPDQHFCVEDRGEFIGKRKVEFKLEDLTELQSPGQRTETKEVDLGGGCDFTKVSACDDSAPHYRLRYSVRRAPDATGGLPVDPNP